ncbi:helix-turn-helix transcriptional regulator [Pseudomonas putida]|nr:helix-turn-helix transcriptional regulator [Pseudomonas putida]
MTPFKKARLAGQMSQVFVAKAMRINQSTYQRWESGALEVPDDKLAKLAQVLQVDESFLNGKDPHYDYFLQPGAMREDYERSGSLMLHFKSGKSLLIPINDAEHNQFLDHFLESDLPIIPVRGMSNRLYLVSRVSLMDVCLSDERVELLEQKGYVMDGCFGPTDDDWFLIEQIHDGDIDDLGNLDLESAVKLIRVFGGDPLTLLTKAPEPLVLPLPDDNSVELSQSSRQKFFDTANLTVIQASNGDQRTFVANETDVYQCFSPYLEAADNEGEVDDFIESGRVIFDNTWGNNIYLISHTGFDFVSCPNHAYKKGMLKHIEQAIDGIGAKNPSAS